MTNPWEYWQNALKGVYPEIKAYIDRPQQGFYRHKMRQKGHTVDLMPVAFWYDKSGQLRGMMNGQHLGEFAAKGIWNLCYDQPITQEVYKAVLAGGEWPGVDRVLTQDLPGRGDNKPDAKTLLRDQIEDTFKRIASFTTITSEDQELNAQALRSKLRTLWNDANKAREEEKRPWLDKCEEVQGSWRPLLEKAANGADQLRRAIDQYENTKFATAKEQGTAYIPQKIKPIVGRGVTPTIVKKVQVLENGWDLLYERYKTRSEVQTVLYDLAQKAVNAGLTDVPGITILETIET